MWGNLVHQVHQQHLAWLPGRDLAAAGRGGRRGWAGRWVAA